MSNRDLEVLAYEESPLGMLCLRRRRMPSDANVWVTEITIDHEFLMSSQNTASERALASRALELRDGQGLHVLVGGLGLGYTAGELLRSDRVARVEVIEFLPQVIDWLERGLFPLADELKGEPRLRVRQGDVYGLLAAPPAGLYDLILVDVDHSPEERLAEASQAFYREPGLARAMRHLAPGGLLGVWSYAASPSFEAALRGVSSEVVVEELSFRNPVLAEVETNWLFFARA